MRQDIELSVHYAYDVQAAVSLLGMHDYDIISLDYTLYRGNTMPLVKTINNMDFGKQPQILVHSWHLLASQKIRGILGAKFSVKDEPFGDKYFNILKDEIYECNV
jgi:DNA-binding response OmpR family regulator